MRKRAPRGGYGVVDMDERKRMLVKGAAAGAGALAAAAWVAWSNGGIQTTEYELAVPRLPRAFDGVRIAQISDLHNAELGHANVRLLKRLHRAKPDFIAITGDLVDSRRTRVDVGMHVAAQAANIAPVFFVPGNHEARLREYPQIVARLKRAGVTVLGNASVPLRRDGERIVLLGLTDPVFRRPYPRGATPQIIDAQLADVLVRAGIEPGDEHAPCTVLLTHRPELLAVYAARGIDVAFAGHAHGGQVRLPAVGSLFAPSQGFFPKVTAGVHTLGATQLVVSRGLGPSVVPLRVNNRPELVVATLRCAGPGVGCAL